MNNSGLSLRVLAKLKSIFDAHHWPTDQEDTFDRFCQMLAFLEPEEQDCVLELTKNFLRVDFTEYPHHIRKALTGIEPELFREAARIYLMPLRAPQDFGKQKSSTFVAYGFHEYRAHEAFAGKPVLIIDTPGGLPRNFNASNSMLILVDDFIGSGETAEGCLNYLREIVGIDLNKILLLALVVQREGWTRLKGMGPKLVYSEMRGKGITDEFQDPTRQALTEAMHSIEAKLRFDADICFGYKQCEALVKMIRTPNNTFPVYWKSQTTPKHLAPFPR